MDEKKALETINSAVSFLQSKAECKTEPIEFFKTGLEVAEYIQKNGFRARKAKIYNDAKAGLLRRQTDGKFLLADVENYMKVLKRIGENELLSDAALKSMLNHLEKEHTQTLFFKNVIAELLDRRQQSPAPDHQNGACCGRCAATNSEPAEAPASVPGDLAPSS